MCIINYFTLKLRRKCFGKESYADYICLHLTRTALNERGWQTYWIALFLIHIHHLNICITQTSFFSCQQQICSKISVQNCGMTNPFWTAKHFHGGKLSRISIFIFQPCLLNREMAKVRVEKCARLYRKRQKVVLLSRKNREISGKLCRKHIDYRLNWSPF